MKVSESWLREWVNPNVDTDTLVEQMTMAGLESNNIGFASPKFTGVVVGEIVDCNYHPLEKKLYILKINVGQKSLIDVVCNASNCRKGLKIVLATIGAMLPGNFKVKKKEFLGRFSEGIVCSWEKLGIYYKNSSEIIELPLDTQLGTDVYKYFNFGDKIIEVNVSLNRSDCLSIMGIARDIAAINKLSITIPSIPLIKPTIQDVLPISVNSIQSCPRYLGRIIKNVNLNFETPIWLKEKLRRCGIDLVNVVVDITNFILIELGQPVYVFDFDRIKDGIVIQNIKNDSIVTLPNNNKIKISAGTLVTSDNYNNILAISGIINSKYSSVSKKTVNIVLECALFSKEAMKNRSDRNICSDTSIRYERGVDKTLQYISIERATSLLVSICGGKVGPIIDFTYYEELPKQQTIFLRNKKINKVIGYNINDQIISDTLRSIGCSIVKSLNGWNVTVPTWRFDIKVEEDIVEEILRIYGYHSIRNIPIKLNTLIDFKNDEFFFSLKTIRSLLVNRGYQEIITYGFVDPKIQTLLHPNEEQLLLVNPISIKMSAMRLSLLSGLLNTAIYNQNRQQNRIRLFEIGLKFIPDAQAKLGVQQSIMIAALASGSRYQKHWDLNHKTIDFYDLKGDLESILTLTGKISLVEFRSEHHTIFHPGQSASLYLNKEYIGFIGVISPFLEKKFKLKNKTVVFEIYWDKISRYLLPKIETIPKFPMNKRDISIVVNKNIPVTNILLECTKSDVRIVNADIFDVYYNNTNIKKHQKSISISLTIQNNSQTMQEHEINRIVSKCLKVLEDRFQAKLRY